MSASSQPVPWRTRLGTWQARLAARRLAGAIRDKLPATHGITPTPTFAGEALRWHLNGDTLEVELHRDPCNELGTTALGELEKLVEYIQHGAGGARAVILWSSVKRGFCAGAHLRELYEGLIAHHAGGDRTPMKQLAIAHEVRGFIDRIHAVMDALDTAPLTVVAAVHGFCFGGGFELALTADVIIAEKSARFAFPELRLGLVPGFGGIPRLERDVGNAVVRDLLMTGRSMNAKRANEVGLVSQVVARGEGLTVARKVAEQAARFDPETTRRAKRFAKPLPVERLRREKDLFIEMMASPVVVKALRKFVESTDVRPYLP
mgnify:FL=1